MTSTYATFFEADVIPDSIYYAEREFDADAIQAFLVSRNSFLANFKVGDLSYAQYLSDTCGAKNFNPKIILVNLQKEQTLVTRFQTPPPQKILNRCLGFGMTDSGDMPELYGFKTQHDQAIAWFEKHFTKFKIGDNMPSIVVDKSAHFNIPGTIIQSKNIMTYLQYLYTPWTGTPSSIFSTGFYFDTASKRLVDGPASVDAPESTIIRVGGWGIHGVYAFWRIYNTFFPNDLKNIARVEA